MGHRNWHIARAKHHKDVADFLVDPHYDWACVALAYSALHYVHSSLADEIGVHKDERHPRKHTAPSGIVNGGRGTNQMVRDLYPTIHVAYISLFEMGRRTRYDVSELGGPVAYKLLLLQFNSVKDFCISLNGTRSPVPTQTP